MNRYKIILTDGKEIIIQSDYSPYWQFETSLHEPVLAFSTDHHFLKSAIIGFTKLPPAQ